MSSMSMGGTKAVVRPPQRGIFPLDHMAECQEPMKAYVQCLETHKDVHHLCRDYSRDYLQCRMDHQLMSSENLENMGFADDKVVRGAREYDQAKEKAGFVAGQHITYSKKWWWQRLWDSKKWTG